MVCPTPRKLRVRHNVLEYSELFLFLLVAMTYINAMDERLVFDALRSWLIRSGFFLPKTFLAHRRTRVFHIARGRQPDDGAAHVCRGNGSGRNQHAVCLDRMYQHRGRRQCWRGVQPIRRHYHPDGMAEGYR